MDWRWRGWAGSELDLAGPGFEHRGLLVPLAGSFQPANAALAVAAAQALRDANPESVRAGAAAQALGDAPPEAARAGLAATRWPGRLEAVGQRPRVVLDGGHNPE